MEGTDTTISVGKEDIRELSEVVVRRLNGVDSLYLSTEEEVKVNVSMTVAQLKKLGNILSVSFSDLDDAKTLFQLRTDIQKFGEFTERYWGININLLN